MTTPTLTTFNGLAPPYRTIVADPPWAYETGWPGWSEDRADRRALPYQSMSLGEIEALPVASLAAPESYLFLWTTDRYLEAAFGVVRAWRFVPRQTVVWCKPPRGQGPGGMFATTTEFVIVAQRIGPRSHARGRRTLGTRIDSNWFTWPRRAHSEKPHEFLQVLERVSPAPRVELFARQRRIGWDAWGDQLADDLLTGSAG